MIVVGSTVYYSMNVMNASPTNPGRDTISQATLEADVHGCLNSLVIESIDEFGLCNKNNEYKGHIYKGLYTCLNFDKYKDQDFKVNAATLPKKVDVRTTPAAIIVNLDYPIIITRQDKIISFEATEFTFPRTKEVKLEMVNGKLAKETILTSPDLDLELFMGEGLTITSNGQPVNKLSVYLKEECPDDPIVLGSVEYVFYPEVVLFAPDARLTINYEQEDVSRLSKEEGFKLAYVKDWAWQLVPSTTDVENNRITASLSHLSDWSANCDGSNKVGSNLMMFEAWQQSDSLQSKVIPRDISCAKALSGSCGYVKLWTVIGDSEWTFYNKSYSAIYEAELIPVMTTVAKPIREDQVWPHPGICEPQLDCKYGENEDGSAKPGYDYWGVAPATAEMVDMVHQDKPQWPLYVEVHDEPNIATRWKDLPLTDYQIQTYAKYMSMVADEILKLNHSESVKIMFAGMKPTTGMKTCILTPRDEKIYDPDPMSYRIEDHEWWFEKGDCWNMRNMTEYQPTPTSFNYCTGESLPSYHEPNCPAVGSCEEEGPDTDGDGDPDGCLDEVTEEEYADCMCPPKTGFTNAMLNIYQGYQGRGLEHTFQDLLEDIEEAKEWANECENDPDNPIGVVTAAAIAARIELTIQYRCYEKVIEIEPKEYITKVLKGPHGRKICEAIDAYADHILPEPSSADTYPGGGDPWGALAYKQRFELVRNLCAGNEVTGMSCIPNDDTDTDSDTIFDIKDNCPIVANTDQLDWDHDGIGDACDDTDGDGAMDSADKCPSLAAVSAGADADSDGWADECDNCPNLENHDQKDFDSDNIGDACDENTDGDTYPSLGFTTICKINTIETVLTDCIDNCPYLDNDQKDQDNDAIGDLCDNCVNVPNPVQEDWNNNGIGDHCEDNDVDTCYDHWDLCPTVKVECPEGTPDCCALHTAQDCEPSDVCLGRVFITSADWSYLPDEKIDDHGPQMAQAFDGWREDDLVIGVTPFHLGDDEVTREVWRPYSWTTKVCPDKCVGKEVYNLVGEIENPITDCSEENACGDEIRQKGEACDGFDLMEKTCEDFGYTGGTLSCSDCDYNFTQCEGYACNNDGTLNPPGEVCDGTNLQNYTCTNFDEFIAGNMSCKSDCNFNTTKCVTEEPPIPGGPCTNHKIQIWFPSRSKTLDYKCWKCKDDGTFEEPPSSPEQEIGIYRYFGINRCFETAAVLPEWCPDGDGTVREGIPCAEIDLSGTKYYALIRCEPTTTSNNAIVHLCGTSEQCGYSAENCCEASGEYGNYYHACKQLVNATG